MSDSSRLSWNVGSSRGKSLVQRFSDMVKYRDEIREAASDPDVVETSKLVPLKKREGGFLYNMVVNPGHEYGQASVGLGEFGGQGVRDRFFGALLTISSPWTLPLLAKYRNFVAGTAALASSEKSLVAAEALQAVVDEKATPHQYWIAKKEIEKVSEDADMPTRLKEAMLGGWHALFTSDTASVSGTAGLLSDAIGAIGESKKRKAVSALSGKSDISELRPLTEVGVSMLSKVAGETPFLDPIVSPVSRAFGGTGDAAMGYAGEIAGNVATSEKLLSEEEKSRALRRIEESRLRSIGKLSEETEPVATRQEETRQSGIY